MRRTIFVLLLFAASLDLKASKPAEKVFQGFRLSESRLLYRRPLLASGPTEGLGGALGAGTEVLVVTATRNRDWVFVRTASKLEGWIPMAWVRAPYRVNPVDVRTRFYPDEVPPEVTFEFNTDVKVWGDELLLEALKGR